MRAETYLQHLNFIRIHISEAPGYGDQTLVAQMVDRIIAMGYQGSFEVVYDDTTAHKVSQVFFIDGELNPRVPYQFTAANKIRINFHSTSFFNAHLRENKRAEFGFGWDLKNNTDDLNVDLYYSLYQKKILARNFTFTSHEIRGNVVFPKTILEDSLSYLNKHPGAKNDFLYGILQAAQHKKLNIWPIYGLNEKFFRYINPEYTIAKLIFALNEAKEKLPRHFSNKPTIMLLLNDFSIAHFSQIKNFIRGLPESFPKADILLKRIIAKHNMSELVEFEDIESNTILKMTDTLNDDKFLIVNVGNLNRKVFDALMTFSSFPPLREGLSSKRLLLNNGRPSIECFYHNFNMYEISCGNSSLEDSWQKLQKATSSLDFISERFPAHLYVAQYLIDLQDQNSSISRCWEKQVEHFLSPGQDLINNVLSIASNISLKASYFNETERDKINFNSTLISTHSPKEYIFYSPNHFFLLTYYLYALFFINQFKPRTSKTFSALILAPALLSYLFFGQCFQILSLASIFLVKNTLNTKEKKLPDHFLALLPVLTHLFCNREKEQTPYLFLTMMAYLIFGGVLLTAQSQKKFSGVTNFFESKKMEHDKLDEEQPYQIRRDKNWI